jgi:type VI secretion system protein VasG
MGFAGSGTRTKSKVLKVTMASVNLKSLIGMLDTASTPALTTAAGLCLCRTGYHVEVGHWLAKQLKGTQNEVAAILKFYGIDTSKIAGDAQKATDRLKTGNGRQPGLFQYVVDLARDAWLPGATNFASSQNCSDYLILPLVSERPLLQLTQQTSPGFSRINANVLARDLLTTLDEISETVRSTTPAGRKAAEAG